MAATRDRVVIFPSRANLVLMRQRIAAAVRGHSLLKRKRDALEMKYRELTTELRDQTEMMHSVMKEAIFSLAKATYLGTDFKPAAIMGSDRADCFIRIRQQKVVGLPLPTYELNLRNPTSLPLTGLSRGGVQVEIIREKFQEALKFLILLASLQFSVKVLTDGMRRNNMRINGLEYVLIPRFQNTADYIRDELEEYAREDFYRLKRSQAKQRKAKENFTRMIKLRGITLADIERANMFGILLPETVDELIDLDKFKDYSNAPSKLNLSEDKGNTFDDGEENRIDLQEDSDFEDIDEEVEPPLKFPVNEDATLSENEEDSD